jgi:hypothetical protein
LRAEHPHVGIVGDVDAARIACSSFLECSSWRSTTMPSDEERHEPLSELNRSEIDEALAAMDAAELREVVRDVLLELDPRADSRAVNSLLERAARGKSGWAPRAPGHDEVAEVVAFVPGRAAGRLR